MYSGQTAHAHFVQPSEEDTCPVCGMSLTDHPAWIAVIMFKDGRHAKFHGPKNMFIYYFRMGNYTRKYKDDDIAGLYVTDYLSLKHMKAQNALYVIGSEVEGPMGEELIPMKDSSAAGTFVEEHGGRIITFSEVTPEIIDRLKNISQDNSL